MRPLIVLVLAAAGCQSYLVPPSGAPIPSRAVPTRGGEELVAEDGELSIAPHPRDIGTALGVRLGDAEGAALVTACLRDRTGLEPGDRIVWAAAAFPVPGTPTADVANSFPGWGAASRASLPASSIERRLDEVIREGKRKSPPAPAAVRAARLSHAVRGIEDLEGYACAVPYVHLDLVVERRGATLTACARPRFERRPVFARRVRAEAARRHDVEIVSLDGWPERDLPLHAGPGDELVVRVAEDARAGVRHLRPLDVVRGATMTASSGELDLAKPDGETSGAFFVAPPRPTSVWVPFLLVYESDGRRSHLGLGPLDALFHWSSKREYNAELDGYETTSRWSLFTTLARTHERGPSGTRTKTKLAVFDDARTDYFKDWLGAQDE